ncbi:TPA: hypothetical protein ACGUMO_002866 [Vibrio vulnificus]|nr:MULTISPECIES: hypothetical protein [Vibrio]EWS70141.1 hypothetical protein Y702_04370 [Vibrio vulnificus BAA87]KFK68407.1 hypothetical protein JS85_14485 [Vibrio vulnificus]MCA3964680.1 hypothetical protein [Vibrio vulnificus]NHE88168.1 hypothetical protein [Vibrio vulnificus]POC66281.1 hypothetical protein CRN44_04155 [Vibrio vulnificus]
MNHDTELDQETIDVVLGALEEKLETLAGNGTLNDFEKLLVVKNLMSRVENRIAVKQQAAIMFGVLTKVGR